MTLGIALFVGKKGGWKGENIDEERASAKGKVFDAIRCKVSSVLWGQKLARMAFEGLEARHGKLKRITVVDRFYGTFPSKRCPSRSRGRQQAVLQTNLDEKVRKKVNMQGGNE